MGPFNFVNFLHTMWNLFQKDRIMFFMAVGAMLLAAAMVHFGPQPPDDDY